MDNNRKKLSEFEEFLKGSCLIPPGKVRFYVYWVDRFLRYYQHRPSKQFNQIVASYLKKMETDSRFAAWQVKQAGVRFKSTHGRTIDSVLIGLGILCVVLMMAEKVMVDEVAHETVSGWSI